MLNNPSCTVPAGLKDCWVAKRLAQQLMVVHWTTGHATLNEMLSFQMLAALTQSGVRCLPRVFWSAGLSVPETAESCPWAIRSPRCEEMTLVSSPQDKLSQQVQSTCCAFRCLLFHRILRKHSIQSTAHFHPINTGCSGSLVSCLPADGSWSLGSRRDTPLMLLLPGSLCLGLGGRGRLAEFRHFCIRRTRNRSGG